MKRSAMQLEEWFYILNQHVPAVEADKILAMLDADTPIHFDLSGLNIEIATRDEPSKKERLPLWAGVSYSKGYGFGRIISATMNVTSRSKAVS